MIKELTHKKTITLFGTTQANTHDAAELAQIIPGDQKILIDNFCERSLPAQKYSKQVKHDAIIHLFEEPEKVQKILNNTDYTIIIYGSFYLI
jgi:hypothetical protein